MKKFLMPIVFLFAHTVARAQDVDVDDPYGDKPVELRMKFSWDFNHPDVISRGNITDASLFVADAMSHGLYYGLRSAIDSRPARVAITIPYLIFGPRLVRSFRVWNHEEGHLQVWDRLPGIDHDDFTFVDEDADRTNIANPWETFRAITTGFNDDASVSLESAAWQSVEKDPKLKPHLETIDIVMEAGGLNQDQYTLEQIQRRILRGEEHILNSVFWMGYLYSTLGYQTGHPNGDIDDYLDGLGRRGINSSVDDVKNVQWLKYLSGSSAMMLGGFCSWLSQGKPIVSRDDYFLPFPIPEWSSYLTTRGPTIKAWTLQEVRGGFWIEPSYQLPLDDAKSEEYGLRLNLVRTWYDAVLAGYVNRSGGNWFDGEFTIKPLPFLDIGLGISHGHGFTYEREIRGKTFDFLKENELDLKGMISVRCEF